MREAALMLAIALWIGAAFDTRLGWGSFIVWLVAFVVTVTCSESVVMALMALCSSVSYYFIDMESELPLLSVVLPCFFTISFCITSVMILVKFGRYLNQRADGASSGTRFEDSDGW